MMRRSAQKWEKSGRLTCRSLSSCGQFKVHFSLEPTVFLRHLLWRLLGSPEPRSPGSAGTNLECQQSRTPPWGPDPPGAMSRIVPHPRTPISEGQLVELGAFCFEKGKLRGVRRAVFTPVRGMVLLRVADMGRTKVLLAERQMMVQVMKILGLLRKV